METKRVCPSCHQPLPPDVPLGLCPECLIKSGFATGTEPEAAGGGGAGFVPPPIGLIATLFPQLEIIEFIGKGGMGAVYKARQPALDRFVALKILPPGAARDPGFAERFNREARALARLNHPNIVAVHDFGVATGVPPALGRGVPPGGGPVEVSKIAGDSGEVPGGKTPAAKSGQGPDTTKIFYLVMEFVDGANLREVERAGRLAPEQALAIVPQICEALQFAHGEGIVHRDIKPENILLDKKGRVKITDFGIAKILGQPAEKVSLTGAKDVVGTPHYMAPEQVEKPQTVDHRADIFSLGVVFYEMLTGELPLGKFAAPSQKVHVDVRLDEVVLRALAKEPERRYQQARQVKTAVETISGSPGARTAESGIRRQVSWFGRAVWSRSQGGGVAIHWLPGACLVVFVIASGLTSAAAVITSVLVEGKINLPALALVLLFGLLMAGIRVRRAGPGAGVTAGGGSEGGREDAARPRARVAAAAARWTARILGTLWGLMFLLFLIGEGSPPIGRQPAAVQFEFTAIAMMLAGFAAGWWRDGLAALLTLGGWALFHLAEGGAGRITPFHVTAIVGVLFAISWVLRSARVRRKGVAVSGIGALSVLVAFLLILNWNGRHAFAPATLITVSGLVTDAVTGEPIAGSRVDDNHYGAGPRQAPQQAWTGTNGYYELRTAYEEHTISASAPGYEPKLQTLLTRPFGIEPQVRMNFQLQPMPAASGQAGPVEWNGNKIVSRVLPYPDFVSLFLRLPIAHAAATGRGVKVAVLQPSEDAGVLRWIQSVAPRAEITHFVNERSRARGDQFQNNVAKSGCRIALVCDPPRWPEAALIQLARELSAQKVLVVVPSDLSEEPAIIETVNRLQAMGCLTVGRVDRQSRVMVEAERSASVTPFNRQIRAIHTDVFSTVGLPSWGPGANPAAAAAGVAALAMEKWPELSPAAIREKIVSGARSVWQATSLQTGKWQPVCSVDPITTRYVPTDEQAIFRFRVLDAAGALGVDTEIPWFLNMLNCQKAWEISKGQNAVVVMSDQGFHIRHPDLIRRIQGTEHFGPMTFDAPELNFHGTDMSRILLAVAPEARIVPVLCSGMSPDAQGDVADNIAKSFQYAAELKADVVSASWAGWFNANEKILASVRNAVDRGVVVSWFHYPRAYPGLLRPTFTYAAGWDIERRLGFADRFLTDPPGFHPVEIEAGLSGTAPQAAGIAALVKSVNPDLAPKQIEELIVKNATPIGGGILIPDVYKTLVAAAPGVLAKTPTAERSFGAVAEIVLPSPELTPEGRKAELLDLDTGRHAAGKNFGENDRETHVWIRTNGLDVLGAVEHGQFAVLCFDMAVFPVASNSFDGLRPQEIITHGGLAQQEPNKITAVSPFQDKTDTFLFRTREGGLGVIQLLHQTDTPSGVKVRYKLVQGPATGSTGKAGGSGPGKRPR